MAVSALIDTGVILALVDRHDRWHEACVEVYNRTQLPLLTSEAVLAEVFHLTYRNLRDVQGVWTLVRAGAIHMAPIGNDELPNIRNLMHTYSDHPMDFADATLVHLAAREGISLVLTIDHDDFETYRIGGRKKFTILPLGRTANFPLTTRRGITAAPPCTSPALPCLGGPQIPEASPVPGR